MQDTRWIFADTETTGFDSDPESRVVEVAWIETDDDFRIVDKVQSYINPGRSIPPGSSAIHGITDTMVMESPDLHEFMMLDQQNTLKDDNIVFVAHNAKFDKHFLAPYLPKDVRTLCTLRAVRSLYPDADSHKLATFMYMFGLDGTAKHEDLHGALTDVSVMLEVVKELCVRAGTDLAGLYEIANGPVRIARMPFGKHRGEPLEKLPKSYVNWALNNIDNMDPDLRLSLQAL